MHDLAIKQFPDSYMRIQTFKSRIQHHELLIELCTKARRHSAGHGFRQFIQYTTWHMILIFALVLIFILVLCMHILALYHLIDELLKHTGIYAQITLCGAYFPAGKQLALAIRCFGLIKQRNLDTHHVN